MRERNCLLCTNIHCSMIIFIANFLTHKRFVPEAAYKQGSDVVWLAEKNKNLTLLHIREFLEGSLEPTI